MKMVLNAALLQREMQSKNLDGKALALAAKVSPGVISNALAGRPVRLRSGTQIVHAIRSAPDVEGIAEHLALVDEEDEQRVGATTSSR